MERIDKEKAIFLKKDFWGRGIYKSEKFDRYYVDVDGILHEMTVKGEPTYPAKNVIKKDNMMTDVQGYTIDKIIKQLSLLEEHLKDYFDTKDRLFCMECITKHLYTLEGLAEEAIGFFKEKECWKSLASILAQIRQSDWTKKTEKDIEKLLTFFRDTRKKLQQPKGHQILCANKKQISTRQWQEFLALVRDNTPIKNDSAARKYLTNKIAQIMKDFGITPEEAYYVIFENKKEIIAEMQKKFGTKLSQK